MGLLYLYLLHHLHMPRLQMCGMSLNRDMICAGLPTLGAKYLCTMSRHFAASISFMSEALYISLYFPSPSTTLSY